jgi:hypothetical protein
MGIILAGFQFRSISTPASAAAGSRRNSAAAIYPFSIYTWFESGYLHFNNRDPFLCFTPLDIFILPPVLDRD